VIGISGVLTDELEDTYDALYAIDGRKTFSANGNSESDNLYAMIHQARVQAQEGREALRLYYPDAPRAWHGQLYAIEGYTVLWLAELFCSGMPLTAVPLVGQPQLTAGFTTQELFGKAVALFDSAIVAGADSARFVNLARVGKGRALLGLGQFAAADSAVQAVPTDFVYVVQFGANSNDLQNGLTRNGGWTYLRGQDAEGSNGLVWSTDPRTVLVTLSDMTGSMLWPAKYYAIASGHPDPTVGQPGAPVRLADGLEARLIQAEAALTAGDDSWLTTLNMLRATCVGAAACAPVPGLTAGQLPPLGDPGSATRLDTLMKERAMWLYMTGHREGDLRRMARVYHRAIETLWPTGYVSSPAFPYLISNPGRLNGAPYGSDVVLAPGSDEQVNNPLYGGCYDKNP